MPHHKQFEKTLRRDAKRRLANRSKRARLRHALHEFREMPSAAAAKTAFPALEAIIDKSAKTHLIHPRTASRLKSRLAAHLQRLPGS
ncbi:MAG TPA: 30S ribosomal protein S20 [Candidatus Krumholzibacteria bacterium]|nr:30S ribosomal protein S20 [Candidatus Krumholzibacteria bacterium]